MVKPVEVMPTTISLAPMPVACRYFLGHHEPGRLGRSIQAAIDEGVPVHVLSAALFDRFESRGEADFANKLLSAMRFQFGGHLEKPEKK